MGAEFPTEHVASVESFVRRLAPLLDANLDVVLPAAILHDVSAIEDFANLSRHHELGARRAVSLLRDAGFPAELLPAVAECILRHPQPVPRSEGCPDVVCLSHADAFAQLANPSYWLYYAHVVRGFPFTEARAWYLSLVQDRWQRLDPALKEMARPHYLRALGACKVGAPEDPGEANAAEPRRAANGAASW
jgi:hypothetical protein